MTARSIGTALSALLLITSSALWAADEKPRESGQRAQDAQMKKHCDEMMKGHDVSKMSQAEHEAMMKRCREMKEQEEKKPKPNE